MTSKLPGGLKSCHLAPNPVEQNIREDPGSPSARITTFWCNLCADDGGTGFINAQEARDHVLTHHPSDEYHRAFHRHPRSGYANYTATACVGTRAQVFAILRSDDASAPYDRARHGQDSGLTWPVAEFLGLDGPPKQVGPHGIGLWPRANGIWVAVAPKIP